MLRSRWFPDDLLPFSRELIEQALVEELDEPLYGATLRRVSVEQWCDTVRSIDLMIRLHFLPRSQWVIKQEQISPVHFAQTEQMVLRRYADASGAP